MGDPRKLRRKYQKPRHPWQALRIKEEKDLRKEYGIKSKKEIWKSASKVRQWRRQARKITEMRGEKAEEAKNIIIKKLQKLGILGEKAELENVLDLNVTELLERRLQTQVFKKGLSSSIKQGRQFISHAKIIVNNKIVTSPSYIVKAKDNLSLIPTFEKRINENKKVNDGKEK